MRTPEIQRIEQWIIPIILRKPSDQDWESLNYVSKNLDLTTVKLIPFVFCFFLLQEERHIIMQVVCETTQCPEPQVQVAALQCLVKIMSLYYQYMHTYMGQALFAVSCYKLK